MNMKEPKRQQEKKITVIPANATQSQKSKNTAQQKRKVAAYARVSTLKDYQQTSYKAQMEYYTTYIQEQSDWIFAGVYADEGVTGTSIAKRAGFQKMIEDALDGKIDLIITKSVSRFARNTVDSLTTIRQLKEHGIECYFEKENIWTFDTKGELLITIMSSLAQEESRNISENTRWGMRKAFRDGKVFVPYKHFLGYDRGPDGELIVNPKEAETVRLIYRLFLDGYSFCGIAAELTRREIRTPYGYQIWNDRTVKNILQNEKYRGDALLQKRYSRDFLDRKMRKNDGKVQQYYIEGNHEAIIEPAVFEEVQREIERRTKVGYGKCRKNVK